MTTKKRFLIPILFLLPALAIYTVIVVNPVVQSIYMSFFKWNGIPTLPLQFVGLKNFQQLFLREEFYTALRNVGIFLLQGFLVQLPLSLVLALIISGRRKGGKFFRTSFFLPVIIPLSAVSIMWMFLLNPEWGIVNAVIRWAGFPKFNLDWLGNINVAMISVALVSAWVYAGLNMIIFAAGLTAIPVELQEAAAIDGASRLQRVRHITLPLLRETFKIYVLLMITGSLKAFDLIFVMTGGGPNGATNVPAVLMYNEAFKYDNYGFGCSIATFILAASLLISLIFNRFVFRDER